MHAKGLQPGFGVFFDPSKTTSGQRFFRDLCNALAGEAVPYDQRPKVVLFNISAPWREFVKAKWRGQKIVLRVDGLYFDRLSPAFISRFKMPLRALLLLGLKFRCLHDPLANVANMLNQNYGGFARIVLADYVIYQSHFSYVVHKYYFPNKPYDIIINGSRLRAYELSNREQEANVVRLVTIFDDWKPAKRIYEIVQFVCWLNNEIGISANLVILGYTGRIPDSAPNNMRDLIETTPFIKTLPRFEEFEREHCVALEEADCYITFSFRDPCPNAVIECMAFGLPVIGISSGGVPDIVGDSGKLVDLGEDFSNGLFTAHRFEYEFPPIDFKEIYAALQEVLRNKVSYRSNVKKRFSAQLDIDVVAEHYAVVLRNMAQ